MEAGIDPRVKIPNFDQAQLPKIVEQLKKAYEFLQSDTSSNGYIVSEKVDLVKEQAEAEKQKQQEASSAGEVPQAFVQSRLSGSLIGFDLECKAQ